MKETTQYGPDRATYKHWLDRETRAVIGPASVLRAMHTRLGVPTIRNGNGWRAYTWLTGFDLQTVTIYR
jgi:hypothetical protein